MYSFTAWQHPQALNLQLTFDDSLSSFSVDLFSLLVVLRVLKLDIALGSFSLTGARLFGRRFAVDRLGRTLLGSRPGVSGVCRTIVVRVFAIGSSWGTSNKLLRSLSVGVAANTGEVKISPF